MGKNDKRDELQSRREFFKKAAKGALPILAAVALASAPNFIHATEAKPMGCKTGGCIGVCRTSCEGTCSGTCRTGCTRTCSGYCSESCRGHCKGNNKND